MSRPAIAVVAAALVAGAALTACGGAVTQAPTNPLAGVTFHVDPASNAVRAVEELRGQRRTAAADALEAAVASRPIATWVTPDPAMVFAQVETVTQAAVVDDTVPVLVAYNIPDRDCGLYSSGGADDVDDYLDWVGSLAAGVADRRAVVVLEPDAVTHSLDGCLTPDQADARRTMLAEAVAILKRQPDLRVYVDAGNASWVEDTDALATALREAGVAAADGFALNVANFETTPASVGYGTKLSQRLDDAHFVIDTSRNGAGPPPLVAGDATGNWCNPPGRRLGTPPTSETGEALVDALLWIKQPGDSDGACGRGAPEAGTWWPSYAAELMGTTGG